MQKRFNEEQSIGFLNEAKARSAGEAAVPETRVQ
jgi:hypothetical protein